jgi:hypothetical protein
MKLPAESVVLHTPKARQLDRPIFRPRTSDSGLPTCLPCDTLPRDAYRRVQEKGLGNRAEPADRIQNKFHLGLLTMDPGDRNIKNCSVR